jgi:hypothetical protein
MAPGELLTRWTIRLALALYVTGIVLRVRARGRRSWLVLARLTWVAGCAFFFVHVGCAFQFFHAWSHRAAYEATARQTAEVVGLAWGGGLYVNYVFAGVWAADACWWLFWPGSYQTRSHVIEVAVQGFLGFVAFNATVLFGAGALRWTGLTTALLLVALLWHARRRRLLNGAGGCPQPPH